ncbi:reverse transcriptase domain-containing protein [Tanacetum coccineum]
MTGPVEGGGSEGTDDREETPPPLTKEQIEGHVQEHGIAKGKEVMDEDLRNPFKEARRTLLTRRIIEFAGPEYKMPTNIKLYDDLREAFAARYSVRRACFKEPHKITKIVRKANESLTAFKERWTVETGFIMGVPEVMKISSFMDSVKSPELAKRFSNKIPATVNEMMERLDDFVRSEEAYASTELPKGDAGETHRKMTLSFNGRDNRSFRNTHPGDSRRNDHRNNYRRGDTYPASRTRDYRAPYPPPRGEYNHRVTPMLTLDSLIKHTKEILATETQLRLSAPRPMLNPLRGGRGSHARDAPQSAKIINVISVNSVKDKKRKGREITESWMNIPISFPAISSEDISEEPLIVEAKVEGYLVRRVYVDEGSSVEVMFEHCFENLHSRIKARLKETHTDLVGFAGEISKPLGKIELEVCFGNGGLCRRTSMKFIVVRAPSSYNIILGRPGLKTLRAIPSTIHSMMKFPTPKGVATLVTRTVIIAECRRLEKKQMIEGESSKEEKEVAATEEVLVNPSFPHQRVAIGGGLSEACRDQLKCLLKDNMGVFAWEPSDMTCVARQIIKHMLNVNPSMDPVCQKRRTFSMEKSKVVTNKVTEWVKAGIVRPVRYPTYISNPVLVKKEDGTWRMCIDFKILNSACLKDYYPLPNIDCKVESVMGFRYKCFLDAYQGYHQIQMAKEDEEKMAFYTDQGTYCYTKMPFGLKNAGATYQRLVDSTFQSQIRRNLEAYADDIVIKSKDEKILLADIAETFDNLKRINMKLNPKNGPPIPTNIEGDAKLERKTGSPSAERSLPFFNTLKNITKENKHEYRWTKEAEEAFQQMKKLIMDLPSLTPPWEKETLYAYLAVSIEAVSAVLLTDRKGRQCPVQYVSRTLNEAERNYAPMEKLALSLIHMTRRLRRYFEAHPVKVIIDQPIKNILNNSEKLAKYVVELGAYNITFMPRNAVKGHVLEDFLWEAP